MILVTGATGNFGGAVIDFLQAEKKDLGIAALLRDKSKGPELRSRNIDIRQGDYNDPHSLLKAFQGVRKLLLVSGNDVQNREQQHRNVIDAAKKARVNHIVYTSFMRKTNNQNNPLGIVGISHINTEKYLKESGIDYTILQNALYFEALPGFLGEEVFEKGIYLPAGQGKVACVLREEMAAAAASVLAHEGHANREYIIANTRNYSMHDVAKQLSHISGKNVEYTPAEPAEFINVLSMEGLPEENIKGIMAFCDAISKGEFETNTTDIEKLLGREPTSLAGFITITFGPEKGRQGEQGF